MPGMGTRSEWPDTAKSGRSLAKSVCVLITSVPRGESFAATRKLSRKVLQQLDGGIDLEGHIRDDEAVAFTTVIGCEG